MPSIRIHSTRGLIKNDKLGTSNKRNGNTEREREGGKEEGREGGKEGGKEGRREGGRGRGREGRERELLLLYMCLFVTMCVKIHSLIIDRI